MSLRGEVKRVKVLTTTVSESFGLIHFNGLKLRDTRHLLLSNIDTPDVARRWCASARLPPLRRARRVARGAASRAPEREPPVSLLLRRARRAAPQVGTGRTTTHDARGGTVGGSGPCHDIQWQHPTRAWRDARRSGADEQRRAQTDVGSARADEPELPPTSTT